jgi:DNA-binding beta-propeller fold protein YncE
MTDPFTVVRAFSWSSTRLATPLGMDVGPDGLLYILDTKPSVSVIDPADGHVVRSWGSQGAGPGEFDLTRADDNPGYGDVSVAPDGRVYVADGSNHRVEVFRPDGTYLSQFGSFGIGDGRFGSLSEIVVGRDGSVFVLDESSNRISKFSGAGKFLWLSPGPGADPDLGNPLHGLAVRADGTLIASCETCPDFLVFDPTDGHVRGHIPAATDGDHAGPMNLDPGGNTFVAVYGSSSELVFGPTGTLLGGHAHDPGLPQTAISRRIAWGDTFWPSPVFLSAGRAFTFWNDGLTELRVRLPTN